MCPRLPCCDQGHLAIGQRRSTHLGPHSASIQASLPKGFFLDADFENLGAIPWAGEAKGTAWEIGSPLGSTHPPTNLSSVESSR